MVNAIGHHLVPNQISRWPGWTDALSQHNTEEIIIKKTRTTDCVKLQSPYRVPACASHDTVAKMWFNKNW
jgi:hypothetical protein